MLGSTAVSFPARAQPISVVKAAFFHASAFREQKWAARFMRSGYGYSNGEKEYRNYIKRRNRANAKKDLSMWRACRIYIRDFDALFFGGGCSPFYRLQNHQRQRHQEQSQTDDEEEDVAHRKKQRHGRNKKNGGSSQEEAPKNDFEDMRWKLNNSYSGWWNFSEFFTDEFNDFFLGAEKTSFFSGAEKARFSGASHGKENESTGKKSSRVEHTIGSATDRKILGLSPTGSLTTEELKEAFRLSALKWHPDRHSGESKAMAEAKFKDCGAAYKALLNALGRA